MAWTRLDHYRLPSSGCAGQYESGLVEARKKGEQPVAAADQRAPEATEPQEEEITVPADE